MISGSTSAKLENYYKLTGDTKALKKQRLSNQTTKQIFLARNRNPVRTQRLENKVSIYIYAIPVVLAVISFALYYFAKKS